MPFVKKPPGFVVSRLGKLMKCTLDANVIKFPPEVRAIGDRAFCHHPALKKLVLPPTVRSIGVDAFTRCPNLEEVEIQGEISIEPGAFSACKKLRRVVIHRAGWIDGHAFGSCTALKKVVIVAKESGCVVRIGALAFIDCTSLVTVKLLGGPVSIGPHAFQGCKNLERVEIHDLRSVGDHAFAYAIA